MGFTVSSVSFIDSVIYHQRKDVYYTIRIAISKSVVKIVNNLEAKRYLAEHPEVLSRSVNIPQAAFECLNKYWTKDLELRNTSVGNGKFG